MNTVDNLGKLRSIVKRLRDPKRGCPWDLAQTHHSLKKHLIEEAYEVISAIDEGSKDSLKEELGDLLLQVFLHAQIAEDNGEFTIDDIAEGISNKLIERHPHVFGDEKAGSAEEVKMEWEKRKGERSKRNQSPFKGIPKHLPSLAKARRMGEKAAAWGFDWPDCKSIQGKVREEVEEFVNAQESSKELEEEYGDLLFALCQLGRKLGLDAEDALSRACNKFERRYIALRKLQRERGIGDDNLEELNRLWEEVKTTEGR